MSPELVMCRECGNFVPAVERDDSLAPLPDSCPKCDGVEFKDISTDTIIENDGDSS